MNALRKQMEEAMALLKIAAQVRVSVRKVWISMASSYPYQPLFEMLYQRLRI